MNHKRVARIMKSLKLFGYTKKRKATTTVSNQKTPVFPDLVGRKFTADKPNQLYVGDITYLSIADGSNMYLATVIDCYSRRPVGFSIADHMRTSLVQEALMMAKGQRGSVAGSIFHGTTAAFIPRMRSRTRARTSGSGSRWDQLAPVRTTH